MNAPDELVGLIQMMQIIIPIGAALRILYCFTILQFSEEDASSMKKRIRNALVFTVLALCATEFIRLVAGYFI